MVLFGLLSTPPPPPGRSPLSLHNMLLSLRPPNTLAPCNCSSSFPASCPVAVDAKQSPSPPIALCTRHTSAESWGAAGAVAGRENVQRPGLAQHPLARYPCPRLLVQVAPRLQSCPPPAQCALSAWGRTTITAHTFIVPALVPSTAPF